MKQKILSFIQLFIDNFSILLLTASILIQFVPGKINAQMIQQWISRYNGTGNYIDMVNAMTTDPAGNIYVTGQSYTNTQNYAYCTIKYNSAGVQKWVAFYNGPVSMTNIAYGIAVDLNRNVYVTGSSQHAYGAQNEDYATVKYDSNGVDQWEARYNGADNGPDEAVGVVVDNSGNCYVTGYSYTSSSSYIFVTIKYNSSGVQQWLDTYTGPANQGDEPTSIAIDNQNNIYVTGNSHGFANDYCTIKYNSQGTQLWVARYDGPASGDDIPYCVTIDPSYNVLVTGESLGLNTGYDIATIKYNSSGVQQWVQRFNGSGNNDDVGRKVITDNSGNVYITGSTTGVTSGFDYCTIKYSFSGVQQWVSIYNGPANGNDEASSIVIDTGNNIYSGGYSYGINTSADYCVIKYNNSGVQQAVTRYDGPAHAGDYLTSMIASPSGLVASGFSEGTGTNYDYTTIKYSCVIGIKPLSNSIPKNFKLHQNFPNPFNPQTNIKFDNPCYSNVKISVYNILGKKVFILLNSDLAAGSYEINWDASNYPSGIYFYKMESNSILDRGNNFTETKKMILTK